MLSNLDTFANFIQILSYQELLEQATADDVLQELQHQNKDFLELRAGDWVLLGVSES